MLDIVDSLSKSSGRPDGGGRGQDIIVFDIVDSVAKARVTFLGESAVPGVYEVLVDIAWTPILVARNRRAQASLHSRRDPFSRASIANESELAIPLDQVLVEANRPKPSHVLRRGRYRVVVQNDSGQALARKEISVD